MERNIEDGEIVDSRRKILVGRNDGWPSRVMQRFEEVEGSLVCYVDHELGMRSLCQMSAFYANFFKE